MRRAMGCFRKVRTGQHRRATALYVDGADAMAVDLRVWDGKDCLLKKGDSPSPPC